MPADSETAYLRVVVVEDDRALRLILASWCRSIGMNVLAEFPDGQAAFDLLSADDEPNPDLILTDCQMPRMDGIALVRQLRARGNDTPVIMLSGHQDACIADLARAAGVNCFVPKPLSTQSLHDALAQTLPGWAA